MNRLLAAAVLVPLLLCACDSKPPAPAPMDAAPAAVPAAAPAATPAAPASPFRHDPALDVFGYYFTDTVVKAGNWQLKSVNLGTPSDFTAWEAGQRPGNFGPFFLEFEDVTSPTAENELGQVSHTGRLRLQADSYRVDTGVVTFMGQDPRVGEVTFSGQFDVAALKAAKAEGPGGESRTVLTGGLQVGAERIRNISFIYFAGD